MNEIININYSSDRPTVLGRELHDMLGVNSNYTTWFNRMCDYGFKEHVDFETCFPNLESENQHGGQNKVDHQLTIPMAKEICMLQRTERGKECRQYFIRIEEEWNSPDAIMQRALQIANSRVEKLRGENLALQAAMQRMTGGEIVETKFEEKKNSPTEKWESEDYTSYLYKTGLPYCFIQSLECAGVLKSGAWDRATNGEAEETKLLEYFAALLQGAYGVPFVYTAGMTFTKVDKPLARAKKRWMFMKKLNSFLNP